MGCVITRFKTVICMMLLMFVDLAALIVGSDSAVSRESQITFPAADSDNEMNGFSAFEGGFELEDPTTTCTFDSFFPVSGIAEMNGGTLSLQKDLIFDEEAVIGFLGDIFGNGHRIKFSEDMTTFSVSAVATQNVANWTDLFLELGNDVSWTITTTMKGSCLIEGRGKKMTFENDGRIEVDSNATLTLKNIQISGLSGENLSCFDNTGSIAFRNCTLFLDHDFTFEKGSFSISGDVIFSGTNQFIYTSELTSTINSNSRLKIDSGATFSYAPTIANRDLLRMTDKTSYLLLNSCTIKSTSTGIRFTKGTVFLDNAVTFSASGTAESESICFGDGVAANDVDVVLLSGAQLKTFEGICYKNTT